MAERNLGIRLSLKDADVVKRGLEALGKEGQTALRRIEQGSVPASRGLLAVNAVAGDLKGQVSGLAGSLGPLGSGLSALGPLGIGAAAGIAAAVAALGILYVKGKEALAFADDIGDVAEKLNLTGEHLQEVRFAFAGAVAEPQVDAGLTAFSKTIGLAQAGNEKALKSFKALHVELRDGNGQWKSNIDVLSDVADHIAALESPEERLAIATKLFGDVGADMVQIFRNGSPVFKEAADRLREMGGVISNEDIARAGALQQELDDLAVVVRAQLMRGFLEAGPQIVAFTRMVGENLPKLVKGGAEAVKWLSDNLVTLAEVAATAAGVIAGGLLGSALGPLGTIIGALAGGYYGMKTAVDLLEGSHDDLNRVQETTKRLMSDLAGLSRNAAGLTREEAAAQADLARQTAAANVERARAVWSDAYRDLSAAQQAAQAKTVDVRKEFGAVVGEGGNPIVVADPKLNQDLDAAAKRESAASGAFLDAIEALRQINEVGQQAGSIPSRTDAPITGTAPASGMAPIFAGGITPTPIGGQVVPTNPRGLPTRLGSLGGDDATTKGDPFGAQKRDLEALIGLQQRLNTAYLDGGQAAARITRELDLQQKINAISDKYSPEQRAAIEQRLRLLDEEQRRGKVLQRASDMDDQIALAQREAELAGETEAVRTRELAVMRAKLELQKQGVDLGSIEAQQVLDRTAKLVETNMRGAEAKKSWEDLSQYAGSAFDRITGALTEMSMANKDAAIDFEAVWSGVISEVMQGFIRLAIFNPIKNFLTGSNDSTLGNIGDLLGKAAGWFGGWLGGGSTGPAITLPTSPGTIGVTPLPNAKGNAFDRSGVVPVPASFSYGAGHLGTVAENRPEGIVPLLRLPDGSLGVGAAGGGGGGKTEVNIYNSTGEKVRTQETVDGRGNRELKVMVGEMVAQEAGRPGSPVGRSLRGGFGAQPVLTRR